MMLHLYFAKRFALTFIAIFAIFTILLTLLDLIEQMRRFDASSIRFGGALELALLSMPETLHRILPLITILSTIALFLNLARTSEMVVTRAAGRSALRALMAPVITAFVIGLVAVSVLNPIVAATKQQYELRSEEFASGVRQVLSVLGDGLWLRQGGDEGQTVIRAGRANDDGTVLVAVSFTGFSPAGVPVRLVEAARATLEPGQWRLENAKLWPLGVPNPEAEALYEEELLLPSSLTAEQIRDSFGAPSAIPIWELPGFIAQLDTAGFSARLHKVWFQIELALPLLMSAMVMLGAGFTMRHTRFGRTGIMVLLALALGFGMFFIRNFAQILGENSQIPVALAAWSPPVAAILLSLGVLLTLEDG